MKKNILTFIFSFFCALANYACPVCERNKPKILRGITHGSNPDSNWDYVIVIAMIIITIFTLFYSIKWLIKPNENNSNHIKNLILNNE